MSPKIGNVYSCQFCGQSVHDNGATQYASSVLFKKPKEALMWRTRPFIYKAFGAWLIYYPKQPMRERVHIGPFASQLDAITFFYKHGALGPVIGNRFSFVIKASSGVTTIRIPQRGLWEIRS